MGVMKLIQTNAFKKDIKRLQKRGKDMEKLTATLKFLSSEQDLPVKSRDHALTGNWDGWRDCHIEPDWLLIYKLGPEELTLGRSGTHADLF